MESKINQYFIDKNINAVVDKKMVSGNYITYVIALYDIRKFNKFNNAMIKELKLILGCDISLNIDNRIEFTINTRPYINKDSDILNLYVGKKINGDNVKISFKNNPHWLVAGSTGSGKSVFLNNIINQLLVKYHDDVELAFIDLKQVEFYKYNNLYMNISGVANDIVSAKNLLNNIVNIMNDRYKKYKACGCLNIDDYNKKGGADRYLICIIDELAELILQDKTIKTPLQSILQLGRASGVFLICATQRPSSDILPGILKVNFTTRICFKVGNMHDAKTILNERGAELLTGNGDGLILKNGDFKAVRFQATAPIDNTDVVNMYSVYNTYNNGVVDASMYNQYNTYNMRKNDAFKDASDICINVVKSLFYIIGMVFMFCVSIICYPIGFVKHNILRK